MNDRKMKNMLGAYDGFRGPQTMAHVSRLVGVIPGLTGKQLGMVMSAVNRAYHEGKASMGAEMIEEDCIYINKLGKSYALKDIERIIKKEVRHELTGIPLDHGDRWNGGHGKWIDDKHYSLYNIRHADGTPRNSCNSLLTYKDGDLIADGYCVEVITEFNNKEEQ